MNHPNDDFMNYMGFRNMLLEDKIEECLVASRRGKTSVSINRGDLSDEEIRYLQKEVRRRLESGKQAHIGAIPL